MTWELQPQEREGDHTFSGPIFLAEELADELSAFEVLPIINEVRSQVQKKGELHYFQILRNKETGRTVYFINELGERVRESGKFSDEELEEIDFSTMIFESDY